MDLIKTMDWRYSTKKFDPSRKISDADFKQIKALLRMSPSSVNLQPWHFIIADTDEGKRRIAKGTQGFFSFNEAKVLDASHVIAICSRTSADTDYMQNITDQEAKDGRYPNEEVKNMMHNGRHMFANIHRYDLKDFQHWMEKQVYLNIGSLLLGAAVLGIDAVPMEGIDVKAIDEEFGLRQKGFTCVTLVSLGYRSEDDFNAKAPKSRFPESELLTIL